MNISYFSKYEGEVKTLILKKNPLYYGLGNYTDINGIVWDVMCVFGAGVFNDCNKPVINARPVTDIPYYSTATNANSYGIHEWLPYYFEVQEIGAKEQKPTIFIGVIAKNIKDFINWKEENLHVATHKDTQRIYTVDNTTYVCLSSPNHCKGYSFDELKETSAAYLNPNYQKILECVKHNLKPSNEFKI